MKKKLEFRYPMTEPQSDTVQVDLRFEDLGDGMISITANDETLMKIAPNGRIYVVRNHLGPIHYWFNGNKLLEVLEPPLTGE